MGTNTYVEISFPEAAALADLTGIEYDLRGARDLARQLLKAMAESDWHFTEPLTIAILVKYARPFKTGVRARLGEDALSSLSSAQRMKHEELLAVRDKHISHSVNAFEESRPIARYWLERVREEGITSIECMHHQIVGLGAQELNDVIELATKILEYVSARLSEEKAKVLAIVRSKPIDDILNSPALQFPLTNPDPKRRRRNTPQR